MKENAGEWLNLSLVLEQLSQIVGAVESPIISDGDAIAAATTAAAAAAAAVGALCGHDV